MLEEAFEALKKYEWGTEREPLNPIEDAVASTHTNPEARKQLETSLLAALQGSLSQDAKDYVCRKISQVGSSAAVPVLAKLLLEESTSHMARFALERIPGSEASNALIGALNTPNNKIKVGLISSIGTRVDTQALESLSSLLNEGEASVATAAAVAIGQIGNLDASKILQHAKPMSDEAKVAIVHAQLQCAESLLANGKTKDSEAIYQSLSNENQSKLIRLAATRGLLACASKSV